MYDSKTNLRGMPAVVNNVLRKKLGIITYNPIDLTLRHDTPFLLAMVRATV